MCFVSLPLLLVLTWLLYVLSYRSSVHLVFKWLSRVVVFSFICTFDVIVGRGKQSIYLVCHLDQKPLLFFFFIFSLHILK